MNHPAPLFTRSRWLALPAHQRTHALLTLVVVAYSIAAITLSWVIGKQQVLNPALYAYGILKLLGIMGFAWFTGYLCWVALFVRPEKPLTWAFFHLRDRAEVRARAWRALPVLLILIPFFGLFTSVKSFIPLLVPYSWDTTFFELDRLLFGVDPWRFFEPLYDVPQALLTVNVFYNVWFFLKFIFVFWQAFSLRDEALRLHFLLAYLLTWIIVGSLLAIIFSSGGPCFYADLVPGADPYAELMNKLRAASDVTSLWALDTQKTLWTLHLENSLGVGSGISAMPSMHVAMATLFYLLARRVDRWLGWLFGIYLLGILAGSVILAWHYAVDGLLALVVTLAIWWLAGKLTQRALANPAQPQT